MPRKRRTEGTRAPNGASTIYLGSDGRWHGRVTMGVRDDGKPDRPHVSAATEGEVIEKVRKLERQRDDGIKRRPGRAQTVAQWLTQWLNEIAALTVGENALSAYRVAVNTHLIPGVGAHRIDRIGPEHFERLYARIIAKGRKPATAHQVHRTARTAFGEAERRGLITRNPVALAKPPRVDEEEVEPYELIEIQRLLAKAAERRNSTRWVIALALGLRQGEVLGLKRSDLELDAGILRVRRNRLRPKYAHGCAPECGRKRAGHCPNRAPLRTATGDTKSRSGRRPVGLPDQLVALLRAHLDEQAAEREAAGDLWNDGGWLFTTETGEPINPRTDYTHWKRLLEEAGVRELPLHGARHTAATVLLLLGVPDRTVMGLMGWSSTAMTRRYQHITHQVSRDVATRLGDMLWTPAEQANGTSNETGTETSAPNKKEKPDRP